MPAPGAVAGTPRAGHRRAGPASRSTACASSATARRGGWASRWPPRRPPRRRGDARGRQRRAARPAPASGPSPVGTAAELQAACEAEFDRTDVLLMAAAVADFRPAAVAADQAQEGSGRAGSSSLEPTDRRARGCWPARRRPGSAAGRLRRRARQRRGPPTAATSSPARDWTRSSSTTSPQPGIGFDTAENEVTILTAAGGERHVARVGKEQVAAAVLDALQPLWEKERDDRAFRADPARTAGV